MNTEYMNLPDNKSIVKDENGNIKKNNTKVNDKILMLENKIKKVKEEKERIKVDLENAKKDLKMSKTILKLSPIFLIGVFIGSVALVSSFTGGFPITTIAGIIAGTSAGVFFSIKRCKELLRQAKEKIVLFETKLEEANKLEEKYESELESAKELLNTDEIKETLDSISLKEKNEIELPKIKKEIEEKTEEKIEENEKKLVLK